MFPQLCFCHSDAVWGFSSLTVVDLKTKQMLEVQIFIFHSRNWTDFCFVSVPSQSGFNAARLTFLNLLLTLRP